ncbi:MULTISPECIES: helix-turn-helix transcriptional regulator [unclassified Streptomyces]|uniref:helix-turn-helix domain-containing protein n=1 Tax=unclassified Streptomyces TaxID=2593676 RepID=UPI002E2DA6C9|nr:helix-turn-helix transcriptional regulator [Streptomyces sp. NBC_00272]
MTGQERQGPRRPESVAEFIGELRALKVVEGLSLRELQRRTGLPRSTIAYALRTDRPALPPWDRVAGLLRALGVAEEALPGWKADWTRLRLAPQDGRPEPLPGEPDAPGGAVGAPAPAPGPGPGEPGERSRPPRGVSRQRIAAHAVTLVLGACLGAGAVLALSGGAPAGVKAGFPVEEQPCPPPTANPRPSLRAPAAGAARTAKEPPAWVGRVTSGQEILSGTDVALPVLSPVTEGDALVVSIMLTSSCPGPVTVTDTQGDTFRIVGDETDAARHRTLILAAFGAHPLGTADSLRATYPHASKYHIAVDEFRGIGAAVGHAQAHGETGGTAFSTGSTRLECAAGDLMVGAVGTNTGSAPVFTAEWTAMPMLHLSSYRLTTAYRVVPAAQTCAATGTTTAQWAAAAVVFR